MLAPRSLASLVGPVLLLLLIPASARAEGRSLTGRTHNFFVPTGETLPAGEHQLELIEFGVARAGIGVTSDTELMFSLYGVAGGSVGVRKALLSRNQPLRLVASGAAYFIFPATDEDGDPATALQGTLTIAHQTERVSLHASISILGAPGQEGAAGFLTAGATLQLTPKVAIIAEYVRTSGCDDLDDCRPDIVKTPILGAKVLGDNWDLDAGLLWMPIFMDSSGRNGGGGVSIPIPLVRFAKRY